MQEWEACFNRISQEEDVDDQNKTFINKLIPKMFQKSKKQQYNNQFKEFLNIKFFKAIMDNQDPFKNEVYNFIELMNQDFKNLKLQNFSKIKFQAHADNEIEQYF